MSSRKTLMCHLKVLPKTLMTNPCVEKRQLTRSICAVLQQHGLIQPWTITV